MQKAMRGVNAENRRLGWPEIAMGIGLHTGEVVVGNIGSTKRSKYGVVGRTVNLTARIESYTVGGQVLVSPSLRDAAGPGLILGEEVKVHAKGMGEALRCRELLGHEDHPELSLEEEAEGLTTLGEPLPFALMGMTGKHLDGILQPGTLLSLSTRQAVIEVASPLVAYANIVLRWETEAGAAAAEVYAKVIRPVDKSLRRYLISFTSVPPAVQERLQRLTA